MRLEHCLEKGIRVLFVFLLALDLFLCLFAEKVEERSAIGTGRYNMICLLIGLGILLLIAFFYVNKPDKNDRLFLVFSSILFFAFLIFATHFYYFETGWDAGTVIWNAQLLADGRLSELDNAYFSIYPNNVILSVFFSLIIRAGRLLPLGTDYYVLVAFQCACVVICSNIIYSTVLAFLLPKPLAHMVRCVFVLTAVLSPWMALPYSDTIGMFFIVLILYVYAVGKHPLILGFLVILGAMIKPTVFIFAIALLLVKLSIVIKGRNNKTAFKQLLMFLIGAFIAYFSAKALISTAGFEIDREKSVSAAHYLMMGLNEENRGVINVEDQDFSLGIVDSDERVKADLDLAKDRFIELWPGRLIHHLLRKELYSFGDGTFAWGVEGQFFLTYIWTGHERIEDIFRNVYYPGRKYYGLFAGFMQSMWLGMILLSVIGAFLKNRNKFSVLYLTIVGMVLFEMMFEPRARHLLLAVPIICILASDAVFSVAGRVKGMIGRNTKR